MRREDGGESGGRCLLRFERRQFRRACGRLIELACANVLIFALQMTVVLDLRFLDYLRISVEAERYSDR